MTTPREHALKAALALSALTGHRLSRAARTVLGEARFVALTGAEGRGVRDSAGALPVSAGRHVDDALGRTFTLVLVVVTGATRDQLDEIARRTAELQRHGARSRPVFVIDSGDLGAFRDGGYVVDHVLDRETLRGLSPAEDHDSYLQARTGALNRLYGAQRAVSAHLTGAPTDAARIERLLEGIAGTSPDA